LRTNPERRDRAVESRNTTAEFLYAARKPSMDQRVRAPALPRAPTTVENLNVRPEPAR